MHTGELSPADVHHAHLQAAQVQDARRHWILEHWPHVVEHAELTRISDNHDPLAHWPVPPTAAGVDQLEQLRAISRDTPETATLPELDQRIADASPLAAKQRIDRQLDALSSEIARLDRQDAHPHPDQAELVAQHRRRLLARLSDLEDQARRHNALATLWNLGDRPHELLDAIHRRANHLAHHAITTNQPWVYAAIDQWHTTNPDGSTDHLQQLITNIAAYRERTGHTGADPIGPAPANQQRRGDWNQLHQALHQPPTPTITSLLSH